MGMFCTSPRPNPREVARVLAGWGGQYVEFNYSPEGDRKDDEGTVYVGDPDVAKGFLDSKPFVFETRDRNWVLRLRSMNRRDAKTRAYRYRTYRVDRIALKSLLVGTQKGKERMFPRA